MLIWAKDKILLKIKKKLRFCWEEILFNVRILYSEKFHGYNYEVKHND